MVMHYVEGHEAKTVGDAALVGRELEKLHTLPLPDFATKKSDMGLSVTSLKSRPR
jgi:hypothetical protein